MVMSSLTRLFSFQIVEIYLCSYASICCLCYEKAVLFSLFVGTNNNDLLCTAAKCGSCASCEQESPAIADKPARRESLPKIAPIRRAYNVVADNTGLSSFV